ncbi:Sas10/U3 ribonucleoprotein (Utp) family protein [Striga hermonthica]|uniref:Sas10/U3 ribonucleoprotein (Utp) family protein n=1 Tax=Striga hermonthica TaxID=68872 RepID=A0A9N7R4K7_STRHE|nr:Sas10/U3 ribonucleoprotein (Utp) family protein [Striga hermonthica]
MGRKGGKYRKKENVKNKSVEVGSDDEDMMNDEIDAFHKNRDVVPLNISGDVEESDEDSEQPVFDFEDEDDEDDDTNNEDKPPKGRTAQILRTQKYLRAKFGGPEDEPLDDAYEEDQERVVWGRKKDMYGADVSFLRPALKPGLPQSSDDEDAVEEEAEVLKLQREKAKILSVEDFGLEDASQDEIDQEPTFEVGIKEEDGSTYEIVKKDLSALTKEEQMDIVYSSAPELIGLLSEFNDAVDQLENKITPLVDKVRGRQTAKKGDMHYLEVKQLLLQSYCQAITFYLLLKSEGQPVRDHPVISRLVEIKSLLDKVKEIDEKLNFDVESFMNNDVDNTTFMNSVEENGVSGNDSSGNVALVELVKSADLNISKASKNTKAKGKHQDKQVGLQSIEMLKIRASLEEKLKQRGVFSSTAYKDGGNAKHVQSVNRQLETLDDFVDEAMQIDGSTNKNPGKLTSRPNKRKVISGDDDIPKRDDIGERRRKHELRVLAGAGIGSVNDETTNNISSDEIAGVSEETDDDLALEYYKKAEREHAAKLAAKSEKYSRAKMEVPSLPDTVDGKRNITYQMEKNRGLTRPRKKLTKNPRKNYKAKVRIKGQVREVRKPTGPYGGEASGINANVSRSRRLNC